MSGIASVYISSDSFSITGNVTDDFNEGRRVRADCGGSYKYCTIDSSSYSSPITTIILSADSDDLDSGLTVTYFGVQADSLGTLPDHEHTVFPGEGGSLSTEYEDYRSTNAYYAKDVLFYYGYANSFNSATNAWNNENVAKDMAQYNIIVFGDGVADTGHADYANFITIVTRLKQLKPNISLFGYVTANQSQANFETDADKIAAVSQMDGIFMDEAGYDFGVDRAEFNDEVDYVHSLSCNICFVNAWNMDHIIGITNDASYPNTTYNPTEVASTLISDDWYLLESYPINTTSYSGTNGYGPMADWLVRGNTATDNREEFGIHIASVSVIDKDDVNDETLFDYHYSTALTFALDAQGSSDTLYGASSATVPLYPRVNWNNGNMGLTYETSPSVKVATDNWQIHYRFVDKGKITCDHTGTDPIITYTSNIYDNIVLSDADGVKWLLTVSTSGILGTSAV